MIPRRLLLAAALASAVVAGTAYYLDARRVPVLVAARPLQAERVLDAGDLDLVDLPPGVVPDGALSEPSAAVGAILRMPVARGQFILDRLFDGPPGFSSGVRPPSGHLVVAIPVSAATALGGAIAPGMRVDLVAVPISGRAPLDRGVERIAVGLLVVDVRSELGGQYSEPRDEKGVLANARLGSIVVAIPADEDLRFADRLATSTFIVFRSP